MHQKIGKLIDECSELHHELGLLTPILLLLNPSTRMGESLTVSMDPKVQGSIRTRLNELTGGERVRSEYELFVRNLTEKLSDLAELLKEKEFKIEAFKPILTEEQFAWLASQKEVVKKYLKGAPLGVDREK